MENKDRINQLNSEFPKIGDVKKYIGKNKKKSYELFLKYFNENFNENINLKKIHKIYPNGIQALTNINLEIKSNEFVVFLGPSGCGKTTLLRMIAGLEEITSGTLMSNDRLLNNVEPGQRGISMVFQNYALYPYMNVYENIAFGLKIRSRKNQTVNLLKKFIKEIKNPFLSEIKNLKSNIKFLENSFYKKINSLIEESLSTSSTLKKWVLRFKILLLYFLLYFSNFKKFISSKKKINDNFQERKLDLKNKKNELLKYKTDNKEEIRNKVCGARQAKKKLVFIWKKSIEERIIQMTKIIGIESYLRRRPSELSGGQRQRVALSRAITKLSRIFLFDEPLSNLDAKLRAKMRMEIRGLHDKLKATTIYVTHDQIEAMTMADKVVVMKDGFIMQVDTPNNLYENPTSVFVAKFVGSPEMNVFEAVWNGTNFEVGNFKIGIAKGKVNRKLQKGEKVLIGIRPQNILTDINLLSHVENNKFSFKIVSKELLGDSSLVSLNVSKNFKLNCLVNNYFTKNIGDSLDIHINPNKIHVFDIKSQKTLTSKIEDINKDALINWDKNRKSRVKNSLLLWNEKNNRNIKRKLAVILKNIFIKNYRKNIIENENEQISNIHKNTK